MNRTPAERLFTIHQASRQSDVSRSTLRYWERRFTPFLNPIRSPGGQRRYTQEHLGIIARIKALKKQGLGLDEVRHALVQDRVALIQPRGGGGLEHLADRVAGLVKQEVYRFFAGEPDSEKNDLGGDSKPNR
ncbi:MAG: helix-turn-helix domain-containing protein [Desulfobacterales bacterium]|jgi:DNA-binding transcriptional MerR regulator|nr:helix-turn-helix domain-containing protein [Desulfobacterales bacterium]